MSAPSCCCCYCGRDFESTPHPLPSKIKEDPTLKLPRRAPRAAECLICYDYIMRCLVSYSTREGKAKLKKALRTEGGDSELRGKFMNGLTEHQQNMDVRKRGRQINDESLEKKVVATESKSFEKRTCVGVFWPTSIYRKLVTTKPIPRRRKWTDDDAVKGIILTSNFRPYIPDGCTQLFDVDRKTTAKLAELATSTDDLFQGQTEEVYKAAKKQCTVSAKVKKGGEHGIDTVVLTRGCSVEELPVTADFWSHPTGMKCALDSDNSDDEASSDGEDGPKRKRGRRGGHCGSSSKAMETDGEKEKLETPRMGQAKCDTKEES